MNKDNKIKLLEERVEFLEKEMRILKQQIKEQEEYIAQLKKENPEFSKLKR